VLDVTTLPHGRGGIVFDGKEKSLSQKRRFWVLEKVGTAKFTLDVNDLKPDCRLTITGFLTDGMLREEVYLK